MKLIYAKNIDNVDVTGLVDVSINPPKLFCVCNEYEANILLKALKDNEAYKNRISVLSDLNMKYRNKLGISNEPIDLDLLTPLE